MPCFLLTEAEKDAMVSAGWTLMGGPFATAEDCAANCDGHLQVTGSGGLVVGGSATISSQTPSSASITGAGGVVVGGDATVSSSSLSAVFLDNFNGTANIAITARSPDIGTDWTAGFVSSAIVLDGGGGCHQTATGVADYHTTGAADGIFKYTWNYTDNFLLIMYFRYADISNSLYLVFRLTDDTSGTAELGKLVSASATVLDSTTYSITSGQDISVTVLLSGTSISVTSDGGVSLSATESYNQTETGIAMYMDVASPGSGTVKIVEFDA